MLPQHAIRILMATLVGVAAWQTALCQCEPLSDTLNSLTSGLTSGVTSGLTNGVLGGLRDTLSMLLGGVGAAASGAVAAPAAAAAPAAPLAAAAPTPGVPAAPVVAPAAPMPPQMGYMMAPFGLLHQYQHQTQHQQASGASPFAWTTRGKPARPASGQGQRGARPDSRAPSRLMAAADSGGSSQMQREFEISAPDGERAKTAEQLMMV